MGEPPTVPEIPSREPVLENLRPGRNSSIRQTDGFEKTPRARDDRIRLSMWLSKLVQPLGTCCVGHCNPQHPMSNAQRVFLIAFLPGFLFTMTSIVTFSFSHLRFFPVLLANRLVVLGPVLHTLVRPQLMSLRL